MITDETIDLTILELARTMRTLKALKAVRKVRTGACRNEACKHSFIPRTLLVNERGNTYCSECAEPVEAYRPTDVKQHAAAKRASMDLTRMLANLRAGR